MLIRLPIVLFILVLGSSLGFGQSVPQGFKYQTAIRDNNGNLLANKLVSIRLSLLTGSPNGSALYIETFNMATNDFGVANLNVGAGIPVQGIFSAINWSNGPFFLKVDLDINNGTNFLFMGTSQLLSVPFALYAAKSGNADDDKDKDSTNEIQNISLTNNNLQLNKNGGNVDLNKYLDNSDSQTLVLQGKNLSITRGNTIVLAGAVDLDSDPTNELQNLSISNDSISISKGNSIVLKHDNDGDSTNEIQALSVVGNKLSLSKSNNVIIDSDTTNEIQNLSVSGNKLSLSKANQVNVDADTTNEIQTIKRNGDTLSLSKSNYTLLPKSSSLVGTYLMSSRYNDSNLINLGYSFLGGINSQVDTFGWQWLNGWSSQDFNAPGARNHHSAIWTGTEMIIWGGSAPNFLSDVNRFNPITNSWSPGTGSGAPSPRMGHTAIWTGTEMIIWGGYDNSAHRINTGGRYNPGTDTWTPMTTSGAPSARRFHSAIWTGTEMIIWGGEDSIGNLINGGNRYNPVTNAWGNPISTSGAPAARALHSAIWSGTEMIIWGGTIGSIQNDGYRYNPITDTWSLPISLISAPTARWGHTAVWTGNAMIIWGGHGSIDLNDGYQYNPITNSWISLNNDNAAARVFHSAVWTGSDMIVWGGSTGSTYLNSGRKFGFYPWTSLSKTITLWLYQKN